MQSSKPHEQLSFKRQSNGQNQFSAALQPDLPAHLRCPKRQRNESEVLHERSPASAPNTHKRFHDSDSDGATPTNPQVHQPYFSQHNRDRATPAHTQERQPNYSQHNKDNATPTNPQERQPLFSQHNRDSATPAHSQERQPNFFQHNRDNHPDRHRPYTAQPMRTVTSVTPNSRTTEDHQARHSTSVLRGLRIPDSGPVRDLSREHPPLVTYGTKARVEEKATRENGKDLVCFG